MQLRYATVDDCEAIRAIYNTAVINTTATLDIKPRTQQEQITWLQERSGAHVVIVATIEDTVAGFASLSPYMHKHGYRTSVENSIYVAEEYRGNCVGTKLLDALLKDAKERGFHSVFARIEATQDASKALHKKFGYKHTGSEKEVARKFGRWCDIDVMQRIL